MMAVQNSLALQYMLPGAFRLVLGYNNESEVFDVWETTEDFSVVQKYYK